MWLRILSFGKKKKKEDGLLVPLCSPYLLWVNGMLSEIFWSHMAGESGNPFLQDHKKQEEARNE